MAAAQKELELILVIDAAHVRARMDLSVLRLAQGNAKEALGGFDRVLEAEPENTRALFCRGLCLEQMGMKGWREDGQWN